jgi:hypothetical protein
MKVSIDDLNSKNMCIFHSSMFSRKHDTISYNFCINWYSCVEPNPAPYPRSQGLLKVALHPLQKEVPKDLGLQRRALPFFQPKMAENCRR